MAKYPQSATRLFAAVLFPFALALMLPAVLIVGILVYLGGVLHALLQFIGMSRSKEVASPTPHQKPHFLDVTAVRVRRD